MSIMTNAPAGGSVLKCVLEPNREDRARYVTIVHYIPEPGWCGRLAFGGPLKVVALRRTLEWLLVADQWRLVCTRSTIVPLDQLRPGRAPAELQEQWSEHVRAQLGREAVLRAAQPGRKAA